MNTQQLAQAIDELDPEAVAGYLIRHPEFFQSRPELVAQLHIPQECGDAVSLLEYQAKVLREANGNLKSTLDELLAVARDNDRASERLHRLTLELIDAQELDSLLQGLKERLLQDFAADVVVVRLKVAPEQVQAPDLIGADDAGLELFSACLNEQRPICGRLNAEQALYLFGDSAAKVASCALIPILNGGSLGLLAIGSGDAERFHRGMGTVFLRQLGDLLGRVIKPHLSR